MKYPKGHEFEYKPLRPSQIKFDELYQRKLRVERAEQIAKEFDGDIFNEPKVSYRDGAYWCFNGQHSIAAWRTLHNGEDKPIQCKVFRGMTWLDEAEAFLKQNGISKEPNWTEKLRTKANTHDTDVENMIRGAKLVGFDVNFTASRKNNNIVAVTALYKAYMKLGFEKYVDMLTAIAEAWDYEEESASVHIISGMAEFYATYAGNFSRTDLVKKLRVVTPSAIIRAGRENKKKGNGYCRKILDVYNKNRSIHRLEEIA